jgi:hypothetical protein
VIELGILKNFDSGTYKAGVQLAGSLTTYFDDVSVAKNIPSGALVIGNYVILAIPGGNPRDACVIASWPQGSPGGGTVAKLDDIGDVSVPAPLDGYVPYWDDTTSLWKCKAPASGGYTQGAKVYHSSAQSIPTATWTALAFNSEVYDTDGIHDPATNNSRLTCKTAGKYLIIACCAFASNATGYRCGAIRVNDTYYCVCHYVAPVNGTRTNINPSTMADLSVDDYVEFNVYQSSGGNLNVEANNYYSPYFMMQKIG